MRTPSVIITGLLTAAALQSAYYYPRLPEVLASHFGGGGAPNGWSGKAGFFVFYWIMIAFSLLMSLGIARLIPTIPPGSINIPNKSYWLADHRREETITFLAEQFRWFGVGLLAFALVVVQLVIEANLSEQRALPGNKLWPIAGVFVAAMFFWLSRMILHFRIRPE
jgi:uncharacterized membrane protein